MSLKYEPASVPQVFSGEQVRSAIVILKLSDTNVYEPQIRARLGTASHFYQVVVLKLRTVPLGTPGEKVITVATPSAVLRFTDPWFLEQVRYRGTSLIRNRSPR